MNAKKVVITGLAGLAMAAAGAGIAMADTAYVGGGTWDYGTGGGRVWSNYYHGSNCHSSSVDARSTSIPARPTRAAGPTPSPATRSGSTARTGTTTTAAADQTSGSC
ncbi:hypothetical protein Acsp05_26390 [Actinokineospora sp. NBRC 105648]|nr:hypothetical protein Acsp05_26390 [Actinokineospora sp. NBRC 105648]